MNENLVMDQNSNALDIEFGVPFTHRLRFTDDVLGKDEAVLDEVLQPTEGQPVRVQFWLDQNVAEADPSIRPRLRNFADRRKGMERVGNVQMVPGGEEIKNDIHILERMLKVFNAADLDRRSYVVVCGGGAVLDAVGFATAIAHRGLRLVRLPTTTLGQADSGIGVKNAVNLFQKKNWLGAFAVPWAVINDSALISTLSDRDFRAGFSEAVKVSLLKSPDMFDRLCRSAARIAQRDPAVTSDMIRESAIWHMRHITQGGDPFEMLEARPLDYGHWSAHKLETMTDFELRHGEAVAIGVAIDSMYSSLALGLPADDAKAILRCLKQLGFELEHPSLAQHDLLFEGLEEFRQHLGGRLTLTMIPQIGQPVEVHEVDRDKMLQAIAHVAQFAQAER